jgi:hypothetical protein
MQRCITLTKRQDRSIDNWHDQAGQRRVAHHFLRRPVVLDWWSGWLRLPSLPALAADPAFAALFVLVPTPLAAATTSQRDFSKSETTAANGFFSGAAVAPQILLWAAY